MKLVYSSHAFRTCKPTYPVFPWSRKHERVAELEEGARFLVELPANMTESREMAIAEGDVLDHGEDVATQNHP